MAKVFITGADGLLGNNVVRELLDRKYEVTAFILDHTEPVHLMQLPVDKVYGDITNKDALVTASAGFDYFIHIAAITDVWPAKGHQYHKVNVEGTANVIEAVIKNNIKRLVHISSASSFSYGSINNPGDEKAAKKINDFGLDYISTKKKAQELVLDACSNRQLPAIVICPTFMIGPYDSKPSSGKIILNLVKGKLPALPPGGKNWAVVKDVAHAVCNALHLGNTGECYIAGGKNLSYKDFITQVATAAGIKKYPKKVMPIWAVKGIGQLGEMSYYFTRKSPTLSYQMAVISGENQFYSSQKAIAELKMPQTPIAEAAIELIEWFKKNGYL